MTDRPFITVAELISQLQSKDPAKPVSFAPFTFYRVKDRGDHVQIEFNEALDVDYTMCEPTPGG